MSHALPAIYDFLWARQQSATHIRVWKACKRVVRWWTGRHMVEHICRLEETNASWYLYVELVLSKQTKLASSGPEVTAENVLRAKAITSHAARVLRRRLIVLLGEIHRFQHAIQDVNHTRLEPIPSAHKKKELERAYDAVMGSSKERDFVLMGFQHKDPYGDFRATGTIGLDHFVAFSTLQPHDMHTIVRESGSDSTAGQAELVPWYSCGLASIHVSMLLIRRFSAADVHGSIPPRAMFQMVRKEANLPLFLLRLHGRTFPAFHQFWLKKVYAGEVKSIMDFEACFRQFETSADFMDVLL